MKNKLPPQPEMFGDARLPAFGIELIRTVVLPDLLGEDTRAILYWSGKKLARKYPLQDPTELISFFQQAGFGSLELKQQKKDHCLYSLKSDIVEARIKEDDTSTFSLEAGFLAEQYERFNQCVTETTYDIRTGREKSVDFLTKWDSKDPLERKE